MGIIPSNFERFTKPPALPGLSGIMKRRLLWLFAEIAENLWIRRERAWSNWGKPAALPWFAI
jgi:hypothetical protein